MKRTMIMLLIIVFLLSACSHQTNNEAPAHEGGSVLSDDAASSEPSADNAMSENRQLMSDAQVYETFRNTYESALPVMFWYYGDSSEESLELEAGELNAEARYRKVGRFNTIEEMKAATEEVFTQRFCADMLYNFAFTDRHGDDMPMYKEVDGVLYRDIYTGGFGWPYELTDQYTVSLQTDDLIVLLVKSNVIDHEEWHTFIMKSEDGKWKFEKVYDFSPYAEYEAAIKPAVYAWLCAQDWNDANKLDASILLEFYKNQYLTDLDRTQSNDALGYPVPAQDVFSSLSGHFNNLQIETLKKVNDEEYTFYEYDESTDSFVFYVTWDGATFVICSEEASQQGIALKVLVIAKSDKASYWGDLVVEPAESGFLYLSNRFTDIPSE